MKQRGRTWPPENRDRVEVKDDGVIIQSPKIEQRRSVARRYTYQTPNLSFPIFFKIPPKMTTPSTPGESSLATSVYSLAPKSPVEVHKERVANWRFSTICANVDGKDQYGASSTPIYQTATFKGMDGQYDYTRSGNPTRGALGELRLARLSHLHR